MKRIWNKIPKGSQLIFPSFFVLIGLFFMQSVFITFTEDWFNWKPTFFLEFTLKKFSLLNGIVLIGAGIVGTLKNLTLYDYEIKDWDNFSRSFAIFLLYLIAGYGLLRL